MSQARLPRTEPSTELITAHKGNNCDAHAALQTRDFSALPKHRGLSLNVTIDANDRGDSTSSYRARALGTGRQEMSRGTG